MKLWKKCIVFGSILVGSVLLLLAGGQEHFMAWGQADEPGITLLTITHGGQDDAISDGEDVDPGAFTAGSPTGDPNTPYDFQPMKLQIIVPSNVLDCEAGSYPVQLEELPAGVMLLDKDGNDTIDDLHFEKDTTVLVKATQPSQKLGNIVITATAQGCDALKDVVNATAVSIDGQFRIIGDQNAPYYDEEHLTGVTEEDETFFRTLGGMRLHLEATLPPEDVEEYAWGTTGGDFFQSYSITAQPLAPAASKGAELKEIYWEGKYHPPQQPGPAPDTTEEITLKLKAKGGDEFEFTRKMRFRTLRQRTADEGDDVEMLQSILRIIGLSEKAKPGYRGTPVTIDGKLTSTKKAIERLQDRDEISVDGDVGKGTLAKIQLHWIDYLKAFEAFPNDPKIDKTHKKYSDWIKAAADQILSQTYTNAIQQDVDPNTPREDLLDAWVTQENSNIGHWGYNLSHRITLGGADEKGSIGFSQINNEYKYGLSSSSPLLHDLNVYKPDDAIKVVAVWGNIGLKMAFTGSPPRLQKIKTYSQNEYPRLDGGSSYTDDNKDLLSKGIMVYNHGTRVYPQTWPEILKDFNCPSAPPYDVRWGIKYTLEVQQHAGIPPKTWIWKSQRIVNGDQKRKCNITAHPNDKQVVLVGADIEPGQILISPGEDGKLDTQLTTDQLKEVTIEEFSFTYSEEEWLCGQNDPKVMWSEKLLKEAETP